MALGVAAALLTVAIVGPTVVSGQSSDSRTLDVERTGNGRVTSEPKGIDCGTTCRASFGPVTVVLTATPASGETFLGWRKDCFGNTTPKCQVSLTDNRSVSASFSGVDPNPSPSPSPSPTPSASPSPTPSPTPSPNPVATPTPNPGTNPPTLGLSIASLASLRVTKGNVLLRLRCGKPCRTIVAGTLTVPIPPASAKPSRSTVYRLRTVSRSMFAGRRVTFRVGMSSAARRAVRRRASRRRPAIARLQIRTRALAGGRSRLVRRNVRVIP